MTLKTLLEEGVVRIAKLPRKNKITVDDLDNIKGYTVPLIDSDYPASTPIMWNTG
jgi:hypothetical protein